MNMNKASLRLAVSILGLSLFLGAGAVVAQPSGEASSKDASASQQVEGRHKGPRGRHGHKQRGVLARLTHKLDLTSEQQQKIAPAAEEFDKACREAREQGRKNFENVLTPEQKANMQSMHEQHGRGPGHRMAPPEAPNGEFEPGNPPEEFGHGEGADMRKSRAGGPGADKLNLTEAQKNSLKKAQEAEHEEMEAAFATFKTKVRPHLTEEQLEEFDEMELRDCMGGHRGHRGGRPGPRGPHHGGEQGFRPGPGGPHGSVPPQLIEKLGLSEAQQTKVSSLTDSYRKAGHERFEAVMKAEKKAREAFEKDFEAILTAEQKVKLEQIKANFGKDCRGRFGCDRHHKNKVGKCNQAGQCDKVGKCNQAGQCDGICECNQAGSCTNVCESGSCQSMDDKVKNGRVKLERDKSKRTRTKNNDNNRDSDRADRNRDGEANSSRNRDSERADRNRNGEANSSRNRDSERADRNRNGEASSRRNRDSERSDRNRNGEASSRRNRDSYRDRNNDSVRSRGDRKRHDSHRYGDRSRRSHHSIVNVLDGNRDRVDNGRRNRDNSRRSYDRRDNFRSDSRWGRRSDRNSGWRYNSRRESRWDDNNYGGISDWRDEHPSGARKRDLSRRVRYNDDRSDRNDRSRGRHRDRNRNDGRRGDAYFEK